jgi:hypothetical protein
MLRVISMDARVGYAGELKRAARIEEKYDED